MGINLTAADTCIIFDSDWNPQNDIQAMARSHRIGQQKSVKVFRLVARNTYEAELVSTANRKLGLEMAISGGAAPNGPPSGRDEVERLLRRGAQDIMLGDDADFVRFSQADIEQILAGSETVTHEQQADAGASVFSKAAFDADVLVETLEPKTA